MSPEPGDKLAIIGIMYNGIQECYLEASIMMNVTKWQEIYLIEQNDEWEDMDVWIPIKVNIRDSEAGSALIPRSKNTKTCLNTALS